MKSSSRNLKKNGVVKFITMSLLLMTLFFFLVYTPSNQSCIFSSQSSSCSTSNPSELNDNKDELGKILAETSTQNKTVIITVVNKAYCEGDKPMLDLFLDGFWNGEDTIPLKDHLLIVAVDETAYQRCEFLGLHCYRLQTDGVDFTEEKLFLSKDFVKMMWRRTLFLGDVLKRGYNFIFTDTDILWLRNPFTRLNPDESIDLHLSTDSYSSDDKWNIDHLNCGFYFVRSNNKTMSLYDLWYSRKDTGHNEQDVLGKLMHDKAFIDLGIRVRYLDTNNFSGFCQNSKDVRSVVTFHTNCCRTIRAKVADLTTMIHDWNRYKRLSAHEIMKFNWSKYENCGNSW